MNITAEKDLEELRERLFNKIEAHVLKFYASLGMEFFPAHWSQEESDTSLQSAKNHIEKYGWGKRTVSLLETVNYEADT